MGKVFSVQFREMSFSLSALSNNCYAPIGLVRGYIIFWEGGLGHHPCFEGIGLWGYIG
jgi:hypothetical protein